MPKYPKNKLENSYEWRTGRSLDKKKKERHSSPPKTSV